MADDRLIDTSDSEFERQMLRAAADEKVPADVRRRALASLGLLAIAPLGTVSAAAASSEGASAAVKALGWQASLAKAGAIVGIGGTVLGAGAAVEWSKATGEALVVDTASVSRPAPKRTSRDATTARPSETTLSIVSKGRTPWPLPTHESSACPRAAGADRSRAAPARAAVGSRGAPAAPLARVADAPAQPAAATSIREEIDLLDRARAQLSRGNARAASEIIGHYFARYPNGELRAEAELVRREARLAEE